MCLHSVALLKCFQQGVFYAHLLDFLAHNFRWQKDSWQFILEKKVFYCKKYKTTLSVIQFIGFIVTNSSFHAEICGATHAAMWCDRWCLDWMIKAWKYSFIAGSDNNDSPHTVLPSRRLHADNLWFMLRRQQHKLREFWNNHFFTVFNYFLER